MTSKFFFMTDSRRHGFAIALLGLFLGSNSLAVASQTKPAKAVPTQKAAAPKPPAIAKSTAIPHIGVSRNPGPNPTVKGPVANGPEGSQPRAQKPFEPMKTSLEPHHTADPRPTDAKAIIPKGSAVTTGPKGVTITKRSGRGGVSDIHDPKSGMHIHNGLDGKRRISVERKDGSRLVAERGRPGYVERGYKFHGQDFARRSYYFHDHEYNRYYRSYAYGPGISLSVYAPGYYYAPAFYGWAYNPWTVPVTYGWGWTDNPWYGFYGAYFTPFTVYPTAAFWLTDYLIAADLQAAYAASAEAGGSAGPDLAQQTGGSPALSPEIKQLVAEEVKNQLALENAEAGQTAQNQDVDPESSGIERLLTDGHSHMFVAGVGLDVVAQSGLECHISDGDVLQLQTQSAVDSTVANLLVKASKGGGECLSGTTVSVNLTDLQEMQNHMRESIDLGLKELQTKQGTAGLPTVPKVAQGAVSQPKYASIAPPPNPQEKADILDQEKHADQAEIEAQSESTNTAMHKQ